MIKAKKINVNSGLYPSGIGFPLLIILIGVYYLLKSLGYIAESVVFWPIVVIALGVYWLIARLQKNFSK